MKESYSIEKGHKTHRSHRPERNFARFGAIPRAHEVHSKECSNNQTTGFPNKPKGALFRWQRHQRSRCPGRKGRVVHTGRANGENLGEGLTVRTLAYGNQEELLEAVAGAGKRSYWCGKRPAPCDPGPSSHSPRFLRRGIPVNLRARHRGNAVGDKQSGRGVADYFSPSVGQCRFSQPFPSRRIPTSKATVTAVVFGDMVELHDIQIMTTSAVITTPSSRACDDVLGLCKVTKPAGAKGDEVAQTICAAEETRGVPHAGVKALKG